MDSDIELYEGSDDEYYNDDDDEGGYPSDQDNDMDDMDESEDISMTKPDYTVLGEGDIQQIQEEDVTKVSSVLSVSRVAASNLLRRYNWSADEVEEAWFDDEQKVRAAVGLLEDPVVDYANDMAVKCRICLDKYRRREMYAAACGHPFCGVCWKSYISISISDGPGCLTLACPEPGCRAAVGQDMVNLMVSEEDNKKYARYLVRSYVESKRKIKWCPAPGCDYAVDFGSGAYDVSCKCSHSFCWNCSEEAHRPVDCDTVEKWNVKNSAESENVTWILANSKACPKCRRPIEKNHGCMHMTCTPPCKFEFCWLCLGPWDAHGERTGGFFACNSYDKAKKEGKFDEAEKRREMAKNALERYTHFYERWAANQKSRQKAIADLKALQKDHILKRKEQSLALSELDFITEAWLQIIECRRVLKWTYAFGYYLPVHERAKTRLFEYLQGQAESGLERLHQCAEKELGPHLNADCRLTDFPEFRSKLAGLTSVTKNYFENLVHALENGLADVGHAGKVRLVEERDIETEG